MKRVYKILTIVTVLIGMIGCSGSQVANEDIEKSIKDKGYEMVVKYSNTITLFNEKSNTYIDMQTENNEVINIRASYHEKHGFVYSKNDNKTINSKILETFNNTLEEFGLADNMDRFVEYATWHYNKVLKKIKVDYEKINAAINENFIISFYEEDRIKLINNNDLAEMEIYFNDKEIEKIEYGTYDDLQSELHLVYGNGKRMSDIIFEDSKEIFNQYLDSLQIDLLQFVKFFNEYYKKNESSLTTEQVYACKSTFLEYMGEIKIEIITSTSTHVTGQKVNKNVITTTYSKMGLSEENFTERMSDILDHYNREGISTSIQSHDDYFDMVITFDYDKISYDDFLDLSLYNNEYLYQIMVREKTSDTSCSFE